MWRLATQAPLVWSSCDLWMDVWWLWSFFFPPTPPPPNAAHCFDVTASCKSWKFGCNKSLKVMFSQIWLGIKCSINELPRPSRGHCSGISPPEVSYTVAGAACGTAIFLRKLAIWSMGASKRCCEALKQNISKRTKLFLETSARFFLKKRNFRWMENLPYLDSVFTCYQLNIFIHAPYVAKQMSLQKGNFYKRISFVCCSCSARTLPGCSIQRLQAFESLQKEGKHGGK